MKFLTSFIFVFIIREFVGQEVVERIFGGSETSADTFPWMVTIRFRTVETPVRNIDVCGGSILSDIYILTAASCFFNLHVNYFEKFSIRAGLHNIINETEDSEQIRSVSHIIVHPNYNSEQYLNDLALVRVSTPLNVKAFNVKTISLSNLTSVINMDLVTIGWGILNQSNPTIGATLLQQVTVKENLDCTINRTINATTQLCASGTCLRDSGGPLMIYSNESEQYELVAVTSFRNVCTTEGLFTRVIPFVNWITNILNNPPATPATRTTTIRSTTTTGQPITFVCNTTFQCGCSSIPVVFHDESSFIRLQSQERIVGGETAQPHSWPWTVSIRFFNLPSCSGTLINPEWVLTAAHCQYLSFSTVHIGVHDLFASPYQTRNIIKVIQHPEYVPPPQHINDIALIRLSAPVNMSMSDTRVGITCLPPQSTDINIPTVNTLLAVIGWGVLTENGSLPKALEQVRVRTLSNDDPRCVNATYDKERQFCAMVNGGGKDACQGDSGGPIHQWIDDHWVQVGIVSYGTGCARENNPGVYTRLSMYYDWIQATINQVDVTTETPLTPASSLTTTTISKPITDGMTTTTISKPITDGMTTTTISKPITDGMTTTTISKPITDGMTTTTISKPITDGMTTIANNNANLFMIKFYRICLLCVLVKCFIIY